MPRRPQDRPHVSQSGDEQIWARVLDTKRRACAAKKDSELYNIFKDILPDATNLDVDLSRVGLEELLTHHFQTASNPDVSPEQRRTSWTLVRNVLHRIDGKPVVEPSVIMTGTSTTNGEVAVASSNADSNSNSKALQRVDLSSEAPPRASATFTSQAAVPPADPASTSQAARKPTDGEAAAAIRPKMPKSPRSKAAAAASHGNGSSATSSSSSTPNHSSSSKTTGLTASLVAGVKATDKLLAPVHPLSNNNSSSSASPPISNNGQPPVSAPVYQKTSTVVAVAALEKQTKNNSQFELYPGEALEKQRREKRRILYGLDPTAPVETQFQLYPGAPFSTNDHHSSTTTTTAASSESNRAATVVVGQSSQSQPPVGARQALTSRLMPASVEEAAAATQKIIITHNVDGNSSDMDMSDPEPPSEAKQQAQQQQLQRLQSAPPLSNGHAAAPATRQDFSPPQPPAPPQPPKRPKIVFPMVASEWNPVPATPKIAGTTEEAKFAPDTLLQYTCSPFSGALHPRHAVDSRFRKQIPSNDMSRDVGRRMAVWDPYWRTERIVSCGLTSPVDATHWRPHPGSTPMIAPKTVVSCTFHLSPELIQLIKPVATTWGNRDLPPPKDGDRRLILRMLPLQATTKKRADCHLWPKGTFCAIDGGAAQRLYQRKQQSHDHDKWLGMCKHLDMTSVISIKGHGNSHQQNQSQTQTHTLQVACSDPEQYFYCISICTFSNADTITKSLLYPAEGTQPYLQKLTLEESIQKAMAMITQPIIMDDLVSSGDEDVSPKVSEDAGKLVFTLTCPLSKALMKIPVRGRCCKHWQCFDLNNFLSYNVTVSGGRWRCASCEKFLAYQDLQLCGLTEAALQKYGKEASSARDRVEFRGNDKTFHLLEENRRRYSKKRPNANAGSNGDAGNSSQRMKQQPQEVMEIIID